MTLCWRVTTLAERGALAREQGFLERILNAILEVVLERVILEAAGLEVSGDWGDRKAVDGARSRAEHVVEVVVHQRLGITRNIGWVVDVPLHGSGERGGAMERLRARKLVG
jgi:hypothetical protein